MITEITEYTWDNIKNAIKEKWNQLTDSDVDSFHENLPEHLPESLIERIEKIYGHARGRAEQQEYQEFKASLEPARLKVPPVKSLTKASPAEMAAVTKRDDDIDATAPHSG